MYASRISHKTANIAGFIVFVIIGMRLHWNHALICQGRVTNRTLLPVCQSRCRASSCTSQECLYDVIFGRNGRLCDENRVTKRATFAFGQPPCRAGGFNRRVYYFNMITDRLGRFVRNRGAFGHII